MNRFTLTIEYDNELATLHIRSGYADSCEYDEVRSIEDVNECLIDFLNERGK